MRLLKNLGDYTVKQYLDFIKAYKSNTDSDIDYIFKYIKLLSIVSNKSEQYWSAVPQKTLINAFRDLPIFDLKLLVAPIHKKIFINGRLFKGIIDASELNSDQYRDIKGFQDLGIDENLHNLLACIYLPYGIWALRPKKYSPAVHKKTAEIMLKAKLKDVCGIVFFYSIIYEKLKTVTEISLENSLKIIQETVEEATKEFQQAS